MEFRHKKLPRFKREEFEKVIQRHALMDDLQGKTYKGPSEPNISRYMEDWHYFCAILQHALMEGKRVFLPGIGTFQLCRYRPRVIKKSGMFDHDTEAKGNVYLKAYMFRGMRKYFDKAKV